MVDMKRNILKARLVKILTEDNWSHGAAALAAVEAMKSSAGNDELAFAIIHKLKEMTNVE